MRNNKPVLIQESMRCKTVKIFDPRLREEKSRNADRVNLMIGNFTYAGLEEAIPIHRRNLITCL